MGPFNKLRRSVEAFTRELTRASSRTSPVAEAGHPRIGLALGGGFARGLAHIGVLKVFEEEKIPISFIAGTSVGAVIGAAYCSGVSAKELEEVAGLVRFRDFARWTISRCGFASNEKMVGFLKRVLKVKTFEELQVPLAVTATDFLTGDGVVFRSGPLVEPVRASCAYPGMFLPVQINGRLLVDGMLAHSVPCMPVREMGANKVVAVYLRAHWCSPSGPRHIFEVIGQCFSIAQSRMNSVWQAAADLVVEPNVAPFAYDAFQRAPELIRAGELAARESLPKVRAWLESNAQEPLSERLVPGPASTTQASPLGAN
ncbi:MAG TPA: patatin-like phospholipase family protein [Terriglobales bacterium]|nr:patatin-like phospholipase family protein [Terriglobales bacterium]